MTKDNRTSALFDFCIVGGGMVGASAALGLANMGFEVALIEAKKPEDYVISQNPDLRVSAISLSTEQLLLELGAWTFIQDTRLCMYKRLSVWNEKNCRTDFDSQSVGSSHLGYIIENRMVQLGLHQAIERTAKVTCFWNEKVANIEHLDHSTVQLQNGELISAKILVGADGANSIVRQAAHIGVQGWQYNQQALAINIKTKSPEQDITWQQFTAQGPIAFLPLYDGYGSLVWYNSAKSIQQLKCLTKQKLKQQIVDVFPDDLVDFEVLSIASFPLTRMHANQYHKGNTVLIGDAAHTINPLAGQGVNLGFKDVAALLTELNKQVVELGHEQVLNQVSRQLWLSPYENKRRKDNLAMMSAMDLLYATFSNDIGPISLIRNLGLKLANHSGPLKKQALKYAMGLH